MALRAAVFDFDGVIVDSEPLHYRSLRDALRPEGVEISEAEYLQVYLAYDDREAIRLALEHHGESTEAPAATASSEAARGEIEQLRAQLASLEARLGPEARG